MSKLISSKAQNYIGQGEQRNKFRRSCLKSKNILFQNQEIQIGCKGTHIYDFYTSQYYLQIQLFIGNKTNRIMDGFKIQYRGTSNLSIWLEQKPRSIRQKTQFKQRIIVDCTNLQEEILLLLDFQSDSLTLNSTPIPITLISFCVFIPQKLFKDIPSIQNLKKIMSTQYQYIEQFQINVGLGVCKKGISKDLPRFFNNLTQINNNCYFGQINIKSLIQEYSIVLEVKDQIKLMVSLASNQYKYFDLIFSNLQYLLS